MRRMMVYAIPVILLLGCAIASSAELSQREIAYKPGDSGKYVFYQDGKEVGALAFQVSSSSEEDIIIAEQLNLEITAGDDKVSLNNAAALMCDRLANPRNHLLTMASVGSVVTVITQFSQSEAHARGAADGKIFDKRTELPKGVFAGTPNHVPEFSAAFQTLDFSGTEPIEIDVYLTDSAKLTKMTLTPRGEKTISPGGKELSTIAVYVMPIDETVYVDKKTGEILRVVMHKTNLTIELVKGN